MLKAPGFYTCFLSSQAYCLNALFYLYQTKCIFEPTCTHWFSTFKRKQIAQLKQRNFAPTFAQAPE